MMTTNIVLNAEWKADAVCKSNTEDEWFLFVANASNLTAPVSVSPTCGRSLLLFAVVDYFNR